MIGGYSENRPVPFYGFNTAAQRAELRALKMQLYEIRREIEAVKRDAAHAVLSRSRKLRGITKTSMENPLALPSAQRHRQ